MATMIYAGGFPMLEDGTGFDELIMAEDEAALAPPASGLD